MYYIQQNLKLASLSCFKVIILFLIFSILFSVFFLNISNYLNKLMTVTILLKIALQII